PPSTHCSSTPRPHCFAVAALSSPWNGCPILAKNSLSWRTPCSMDSSMTDPCVGSQPTGARVPVAEIGCFSLDRELIQATRQPKPDQSVDKYASLADFLIFNRIACWERVGRISGTRHRGDGVTSRPSDMVVLLENWAHYHEDDLWQLVTRHNVRHSLTETLFIAARLRRAPAKIASRMGQLD